ncbi:hypothetical protein [Mesorhizobium sp.]|uniref:hypothetical protein n=1 Tax=Mesorhizobium sp. TaxID=1871066 RepID=UPI000FE6FAC1|nr:hypothetical protein [Mesorhizobium sp.]RWF81869.1 MAG: hypothetical protein EOQ36_30220 [Mesorhizobium sp.]
MDKDYDFVSTERIGAGEPRLGSFDPTRHQECRRPADGNQGRQADVILLAPKTAQSTEQPDVAARQRRPRLGQQS